MIEERMPMDIGSHYVDTVINDNEVKDNLIRFAYVVYLNKNARVANKAMWSSVFDEHELNKVQSFLSDPETLNSSHVLNPRALSLAVSKYHLWQLAQRYEEYVLKNVEDSKAGATFDRVRDTNLPAAQWTTVERELNYRKTLDKIFM